MQSSWENEERFSRRGEACGKGPEGGGKGRAMRRGQLNDPISLDVGYGCREVAERTQTLDSLQPGTLGGISASTTGRHRRLLRQEQRSEATKEDQWERRQGPGNQPQGCGDSPGGTEHAGQEGWEVRDMGDPSHYSRTRAWCPTEKPCTSSPGGLPGLQGSPAQDNTPQGLSL